RRGFWALRVPRTLGKKGVGALPVPQKHLNKRFGHFECLERSGRRASGQFRCPKRLSTRVLGTSSALNAREEGVGAGPVPQTHPNKRFGHFECPEPSRKSASPRG